VVSGGTEKPYYLKSSGMSPKGCFIRVGTGIKPMEINMIESLFASRTRNSLRNIVSPRYMDHAFSQLKIYYQEKGFNTNDSFLQNLDLYTQEGKLNYVAYLLADQNSISFKLAKYAGVDKCDLIENEEYGFCSLVKATERVLDKLEIENKTFTQITGTAKRLEKRMIDSRALREALINAIVHNDYSKEVAPVIEIYSDRLSITSYGGLIEGLSVEEFFSGRSMPRNRELMRIFYDKGIFRLSENFLEVAFPFSKEYLSLTPQVRRLLSSLSKEMTRTQIQDSLGLKDKKNFQDKYLSPALVEGLIEMTVPDKPKSSNQGYRLSSKGAELKRLLGDL
jgi:predicted HTH transcriptional regulator